MRRQGLLRAGLFLLMGSWAVVSLLGLPPLETPPDPQEVQGPLVGLVIVSIALYVIAALRYYRLHRRRPAVMLISIVTAFTLLAEAMAAVVVARNWHLTWWTWHLLMAAAFGFVAYSAYIQYRRESSATGLFNAIALEETIDSIRAEYAGALESLTSARSRQEEAGWSEEEMELVTAGVASRFGLTEGQVAVLDRAAEALARERDQIRRLGTLVAIGKETRVILSESELLQRVVERATSGLGSDVLRVGLIIDGKLRFSPELATRAGWEPPDGEERQRAISDALTLLQPVQAPAGLLILPLTIKGHPSGVLEVHRARGEFGERDRSLLQSLASQLSIALENARLYSQLEGLFRQYMSPDVATALLADPSQAALGGAVVEASALFADLRGFMSFSERSLPEEIVAMLNRYFSLAVPCVLARGGTVVQFVGDAMLALFNAPVRQGDHALRAAQAALEMQDAIETLAAANPGWPRFRVGVNTGPALVGNIGSDQLRAFNAMGDAVNVASRLQSMAAPGGGDRSLHLRSDSRTCRGPASGRVDGQGQAGRGRGLRPDRAWRSRRRDTRLCRDDDPRRSGRTTGPPSATSGVPARRPLRKRADTMRMRPKADSSVLMASSAPLLGLPRSSVFTQRPPIRRARVAPGQRPARIETCPSGR